MSPEIIYLFMIIFVVVFVLWIRTFLENSNTLIDSVKRYVMQQAHLSEAEVDDLFKQPDFLQWLSKNMADEQSKQLNDQNAVAIYGQKIIRYYHDVYKARQ